MTRTTRVLAVAATVAAVAAVPAAASAKPVNYKGKTSGGHTITFKREGKRVWWISTMVPTVCLPTNRVGERSITGAEIFTPPGYEIVNRKVTFKDLQKPALYYNDVTKHYEITLKKGKKGKLRGKLHLTFSFIIPTFPMPSMIYYSCVGKANFAAKPVRRR
jgi:hypothetical protein